MVSKEEMLSALQECEEVFSGFMGGPDFGKNGPIAAIRALIEAAPSKPRVSREQVRDIVEYVIAAHGWDEHEQIISKVAEDLRAAGVEVVDECYQPITTSDMLGRLFALIHDCEPCSHREYEVDVAIRRTLEFAGRVRVIQSELDAGRGHATTLMDAIRRFSPEGGLV